MMDLSIMCNLKVDAEYDKPTKGYHSALRFLSALPSPFRLYKHIVLALWPAGLLFWFTLISIIIEKVLINTLYGPIAKCKQVLAANKSDSSVFLRK